MNKNIAIFRKKVELLISQFGDNIALIIVSLKANGTTDKKIREMIDDKSSLIGIQKTALNRKIKSEVARLVNRLHIQGYLEKL